MKELIIRVLMVEPLKAPKEVYLLNYIKVINTIVSKSNYYTCDAELLIVEDGVGILRNEEGSTGVSATSSAETVNAHIESIIAKTSTLARNFFINITLLFIMKSPHRLINFITFSIVLHGQLPS